MQIIIRYLVLWYYDCILIKLLWARLALFFEVHEHDSTMDVLLENGLSDIRCCYHSNICQLHVVSIARQFTYYVICDQCLPHNIVCSIAFTHCES